jgi:hypothetical protein
MLTHAYFEGLSPANLPAELCSEESRDIFTWYAQWDTKLPDLCSIDHVVASMTERTTQGLHVSYTPPAYQLAGRLGCALKLVGRP